MNIFEPIATDAPPTQIKNRGDHPIVRNAVGDGDEPVETNKFYANFFLGSQSHGTWTHPYSLTWSNGGGPANSWGISVSHTERSQFSFEPSTPSRYYISPIGIQSFVFSAEELGSETKLRVRNPKQFSAEVELSVKEGDKALISLPVVQGMGFITANYHGAKPLFQSGVLFRTLTRVGFVSEKNQTAKYRVRLEDGSTWLLYATPVGTEGIPPFELMDSKTIKGPENFDGFIQVAKNPLSEESEKIYDLSAGVYAIGGTLTGSVDGGNGSYTIGWKKGGLVDRPLLMFALPHHVDSFDDATRSKKTNIQLQSITKGIATAVQADQLTMIEASLPDQIGFDPWSPDLAATEVRKSALSEKARKAIQESASVELSQNMDDQSNLDSMYYSGKALAKFASILYAESTVVRTGSASIVPPGLDNLKSAFARFVENRQKHPLAYDTVWKGVVSTASYGSGDLGHDFGNTGYNDHHFHYGYHIFAAAVIGYLDKDWLSQGTNKAWVNALVRDFDNPSEGDRFFPVSRAMDWYHGHSWAKGLFESADGKDQESTSEDAFASYAVKMWARVVGDANMEARANLQLAVKARSMRAYFLMDEKNTNQPKEFIGNRVTGILFENKVDHTTYFGSNVEYIHGIHMIPVSPVSAYVRTKAFTKLEWDQFFNDDMLGNMKSGWRGILEANRAIFDPQKAFDFFVGPDFNDGYLDGGASRTCYLAYAAGLGGA
ncbi:endo-1,3-beta-glucanase Engl1 [Eremomyces bilateralis CBS 781.70]|uniref:glucan endo-1,3-beta-D-glucosidase n=1 Tax=Eremomyces bilateralis CBS 781.70 TaxID=1392243 RepID=A0A6G1G4E9_9PEZI|nr:endo-1,3-beta-glucanase Engl1 [Eremomyces bilateralis CBS 781.70]KAF1812786.1 endo-1,3-beta-glucanase Engl1 [Eremomyces bilateralis CBS 781.70]